MKTMVTKRNISPAIRATAVMLMILMCVATVPLVDGSSKASAATVAASGKIKSKGVILRKGASTSSKSLATLKKNAKVTISSEVFTGNKSTAADKVWYKVSVGKKSGYVRSDLVKKVSYSNTSAATTDALNYRSGPSTSFKKLGTAASGTVVTLLVPAKVSGGDQWYKVSVDGKIAYMNAAYVSMNAAPQPLIQATNLDRKSELARALLTNPTLGGKARYVYTFNSKNCTKLFGVKGYSGISTPQGLAFSGSQYFVLYGTHAGQRIVTYAANGKRLAATKFAFGIGHPNGITYDAATGLCYVFKGHQKKIYTWHPGTNAFGKSKTPDNASGGAYDASSGKIYASSKPRLYIYSGDGAFTRERVMSRCSHGIYHSSQDCGASGGFLFCGVSGANYRKVNFLDVYRVADGAYLGSIKISLGEVESAVVGNDGFVQLLINVRGKTDYVYKTPLNVKELM